MFQHDRDRLATKNLKTLRGLRGLRIFAFTLWPANEHGPERIVDTKAGNYPDDLRGTIDFVFTFGFRTWLTIWPGIEQHPTQDDRKRFLRDVIIPVLRATIDKILGVEIANEAWQNGFPGEQGKADLHELAAMLRAEFPHLPIALTAGEGYDNVAGDGKGSMFVYQGSVANVRSYDQERSLEEDGMRAVRQAFGQLPAPGVGDDASSANIEPPGPWTTGGDLQNATAIVASAIETFACGGAIYCLHLSATGTAFAKDSPRQRPYDNYADVVLIWTANGRAYTCTMDELVAALVAVQDGLPQDLPDWGMPVHTYFANDGRWPYSLYGAGDEIREGSTWHLAGFPPELGRGYFTRSGKRGIILVLKHETERRAKATWPHSVTALNVFPKAMTIRETTHRPNGPNQGTVTLLPGEEVIFPPDQQATLLLLDDLP